ncbi:MAG: tryptophan synthase subunit alpha [Coriobacteriales bacterium]|jgi:tryptophan synthase alpha chain|nr:tryptophan synthase subunit alpha [Coriobacteriales bacterium]
MSRIAAAFGSGAAVAGGGAGGGEVRATVDAVPASAGDGVLDVPLPAPPARSKAFIAFVTGGDPSLEYSERYIRALVEGGADLIEIGVPFSDPIAEGPVIQEANLRALAAGTTLDGIFGLVRSLRQGHGAQVQQGHGAQNARGQGHGAQQGREAQAPLQVPIVLLTYLNPVHHYGYRRFFAACAEAGVDGIIVPDLPYEEKGELSGEAAANGIDVISLIAPTSAERVAAIAADATGYLYLVSSLGVTGVRSEIDPSSGIAAMVGLVREATDVPVAVGFGVHTPEQAHDIAQVADADGVIVGSAIVRMIAADPEGAPAALTAYARSMKEALP